jgi:hypothetical protein
MNAHDVTPVIGSACLWIVVIVRRKSLYHPGPGRDVMITFAGLATTALAGVLPIYQWLSRELPGIGTAAALRDLLTMLSATALCNFVAEVEQAEQPDAAGRIQLHRRRHWAAGVVLSVISVIPWLFGGPHVSPDPSLAEIPDWLDTTWRTPVHIVPIVCLTGWALYVSVRSAWINAAREHGSLRYGLFLIGTGALMSAPFLILKLVSVIVWMIGDGPATIAAITSTETAAQAASLTIVALGAAYIAIGHRNHQRQARGLIQRIAPLWQLMPESYHHSPSAADAVTELADQTVTINDYFLELGEFGRSDVRQQAFLTARDRGHPTDVAWDIADATWLSDALRAQSVNDQQETHSDSPRSDPDTHAAALRLAGIAEQWSLHRGNDHTRADPQRRVA